MSTTGTVPDGHAEPALGPGRRLGPYEIVGRLGAGGMGEVWRAKDTRLGREVAVKVLPEKLFRDPETLDRFEREAKAVAALSHSAILALHDFGREGSTAYAVMELLEGATLRARIEEGLPLRKAVDYAVQIAHGLAAAHDRGIVHRDLKPENLFVTRDGRAKILDFGLARAVDPERNETLGRSSTDPGTVLGTVGYMSPEQVRGAALDARSDIFSFGCVLYEMLTGVRAFRRETAPETMTAILRDDPPPLADRQPPLPQALVRLVLHCLEKSPDERFHSARDLAFALESLTGSMGSLDSIPYRPRPPRLRLRALALPAAGLGLLGAGVLIGMRVSPPAAPSVAEMRYLTHSGQDSEASASPDGRTVAFTSMRDGPSRIWLKQLASGNEAVLTDGPDRLPRFTADGDSLVFVRDEAEGPAVHLVPALGGTPRRLLRNAMEVDPSPDGRQIAAIRPGAEPARPSLVLAAIDGTGERVVLTAEDARLWSPRWSPDGSQLAVLEGGLVFGLRGRVVLVDVASGARRVLETEVKNLLPRALAWASPRQIVCAYNTSLTGAAGRLMVHDTRDGGARPLLATPMPLTSFDVLGAGGVVIGSFTVRQNLREVPLAGGEGRWLTRGSSVDRQPSYSRDGEWIAFSSDRGGGLDIWAVSTRTQAVRRLSHDEADEFDPSFTPDGKALLWSSRKGGHSEVWMADADGIGPRAVTADGVDAQNGTLTPDGRTVVYASANPAHRGLWKVPLDDSRRAARVTSDGGLIPEASPDGRRAAYVATEPTGRAIRVVELADGRKVAEIALDAAPPPDLGVFLGRPRWTREGALAFMDLDADRHVALYVQELAPGARRQPLAALDHGTVVESFALSPDGQRLAVSLRERLSALLLVEGLPGLDTRPPR